MKRTTSEPRARQRLSLPLPVVAAIGWLVPGLGHVLIGERARGLILIVTITVTFWGGVAIGGVKHAVEPHERTLWFLGQICTGAHALVAYGGGKLVQESGTDLPTMFRAYGRSEEIAVVYTAICGMLNILIILDLLVRAERATVTVGRAPPPRKGVSA
jgi:hypothetical protein